MALPTLADLRTLVRSRAHLSANDPSFPDDNVSRAIAMAADDVATSNPDGWWFQRYETTIRNLTGADSAVMAVAVIDRTRVVQKIGYVFVSFDGNYWTPVRQRDATDAMAVSGGVIASNGALPISWGQTRLNTFAGQRAQIGIAFSPPLPLNAYMRVGFVVGPGNFTADGDTFPWLPAQFMGAVIEGACMILHRQQRKQGVLTSRRKYITLVTLAQSAHDGWMKALRLWWDKPYSGPGYPVERGQTRWW